MTPAVSADVLASPVTSASAPAGHLSGAIEHEVLPGTTAWSSYGPAPRRCIVLDGVFLAIDLLRVGDVRFDERFDFHFYDLDFCLTAHLASLPLGTVNVHACHRSPGDFTTTEYFRAQERFRAKWGPILATPGDQGGLQG